MSQTGALPLSPAVTAPMRPTAVRLLVRDLPRTAEFYRTALGLEVLDRSARSVSLGSGKRPFLHLETRPGVIPAGRKAAGLFHNAFLLPDRASLGAWLAHAIRLQAPIVGASDHLVSEAIYLTDPEGNGVEIYADRPPSHWRDEKGNIHMATMPLDLSALLDAADRPWGGFPAEGTLGHVHLQVGRLPEADLFWRRLIGFDLTTTYPGAYFYATGDYHHHVAANVWNSRNAPARQDNLAGLEEIELAVSDDELLESVLARAQRAKFPIAEADGAYRLKDPWNITVTLKKDGADAG